MARHVLDKPRTNTGARLPRYVKFEAQERVGGPHPAVEALRRQARPLDNGRRNRAFRKVGTTASA